MDESQMQSACVERGRGGQLDINSVSCLGSNCAAMSLPFQMFPRLLSIPDYLASFSDLLHFQLNLSALGADN